MMKSHATIKPPIITIIGSAGAGKNTLGGKFKRAVFIQAEDSETVFEGWDDDVTPSFMPRLPRPKKGDDGIMITSSRRALVDQMRWLASNDHDRKTVVVDTVTELDKLFQAEICLSEGVQSIGDACGGYSKAFDVVAGWHSEVMLMATHLRAKGMSVVFLGHQGNQKIKASPDKDEYSVFAMDMHEKSFGVYVKHSDIVAYIGKEVIVKDREVDRKGRVTKFGKLLDTGTREIITSGDGRVGYVLAKSRYPMPTSLPFTVDGENPLLDYIPYFQQTKQTQQAPTWGDDEGTQE